MAIRLQDSRLQALVEQMTANDGKIDEAGVKTLIDSAYSDDEKISPKERKSLQSFLREYSDRIESGAAQEKLAMFNRMSNAGLRDAAHQFARDGRITKEEGGQLRELAMKDGRLSGREKVTLKALMGFYSPEMEPGARELMEGLQGGGSSVRGGAHAAEAQAVLSDIAGDGKISLGDLQQTESELTQKYGADKAKEILITALGQEPGKIEFEAIDYLQGKIGSMDGHIEGYQKVLLSHLAGAKLLDANFDGKLDNNDLLFTKDADGKVNTQRIGKALRDRVMIGDAMVNAAHAMAEAKHRFGDLEFNPVVWEADEDEDDPTTMYRNTDFSPSVALMDIFNNPEMYQFECATALVILRYRAIHDLIGPKDFDRICDDLKIGVWDQEDHAAEIWKVSGRGKDGEDVEMTPETKEMLKPGDYAYFKNWDVTEAAKRGGWQGENVIYLGDDMYYGHPFRLVSGDHIVKYLNNNRHAGSTHSASLLDLHATVDSKVLTHDLDPTDN